MRSGIKFQNFIRVACASIPLVITLSAFGRVEYAVQHHITSCTACHVSPFGGGPRYVDGKLYGSRFDTPSELSRQDLVSADARALAFYPKGGTTARQGTGLMTASVGANVPVKRNPGGSELRAVGVYSVGVLYQNPRDVYGLWQSAPREQQPYYIQVGRFNAPFGLMTDEHLTFTRLLTRTGIFDYEFGGALSGDFAGGLHYDFALTNGMVTGGDLTANSATAPDATSGGFLNVRWMPRFLPLLLGVSGEYQDRLTPLPSPYAVDTYFALSLDRMTRNWLSGSILGEGVYAEHWADSTINPNINRYFIPQTDADYTAYVMGLPIMAWYTQINLNFARRWQAQYKLESLVFDPRYSGDRYLRSGFGFKYYADSNLILMSRYEIANAGRPDVSGTNIYAASDAFWMMLQLWL